jgi:hypothetical protein
MFVGVLTATNSAHGTKLIKSTFTRMGDTFWNLWQFSKLVKNQLLAIASQHQLKML